MVNKFTPCLGCGEQVTFIVHPRPYCNLCKKKLKEEVRYTCTKCGGVALGQNLCEDCIRVLSSGRQSYDEIRARNQSQQYRQSRTTDDKVRLDG